jgi:hypothetical protein
LYPGSDPYAEQLPLRHSDVPSAHNCTGFEPPHDDTHDTDSTLPLPLWVIAQQTWPGPQLAASSHGSDSWPHDCPLPMHCALPSGSQHSYEPALQ